MIKQQPYKLNSWLSLRHCPQNKTWKIVDGLSINDFSRAKMDATAAELVEERDTAVDFLSQWLTTPTGQQQLLDPLKSRCSRL